MGVALDGDTVVDARIALGGFLVEAEGMEETKGDIEAGIAAAAQVVVETWTTPFQHHNPMETGRYVTDVQQPHTLPRWHLPRSASGFNHTGIADHLQMRLWRGRSGYR